MKYSCVLHKPSSNEKTIERDKTNRPSREIILGLGTSIKIIDAFGHEIDVCAPLGGSIVAACPFDGGFQADKVESANVRTAFFSCKQEHSQTGHPRSNFITNTNKLSHVVS